MNKAKDFLMSRLQIGKFSYNTGKIEIKNIVDGLLRYEIFVGLPILIIFALVGWLQNNFIYLIVGFAPIAIFSLIHSILYIFFAFKDPDRLQTEKFQLEKFTQQLAAFSKQQTEIENTSIKVSLENNRESLKIKDIKEEEIEAK